MDVQAVPDFVKHVLSHYKTLLEAMDAFDPYSSERDPYSWASPGDTLAEIRETTEAIRDVPGDWLPTSKEPYLKKYRQILCPAFTSYVSDLKRVMLGTLEAEMDAKVKEYFVKKGLKWTKPDPEKLEVEPNLERQLRAETELASNLRDEFCEPIYAKWRSNAEEWKRKRKNSRST